MLRKLSTILALAASLAFPAAAFAGSVGNNGRVGTGGHVRSGQVGDHTTNPRAASKLHPGGSQPKK